MNYRDLTIKCLLLSSFLIINSIALPATAQRNRNRHRTSCGSMQEEAYYRTENHQINICLGEASFQMIVSNFDGTERYKMPATKRGNRFDGSNQYHNYSISPRRFQIGTDGEPPVREKVIKYESNGL
ncbi:MAG: hypothetical protein WBA93_12855 [Microcoleaceae cyanobacterium]